MRKATRMSVAAIAVVAAISSTAVAGPATATGPTTLAQRAKTLGLTCSKVTTPDGVKYARCSGEIKTFDGIGLESDLSIPLGATHPRPTLFMLHGWSGDKGDWEADGKAGHNTDTWHWNNVWFVSRGWVVLNYTARGFQDSCGSRDRDANCARGYTHLGSRGWETRDSKTLFGKLVDAGIANPRKLASTGGSYGGGQSWLLATSLPWKSPKGRTLRLRAAVAKYPWTDLLDSLVVSGRATSGRNQHRSHFKPFGVPKESYIDGLYAAGRALADGRYDDNPNHPATNIDMQYADLHKGDPYDPTDPRLKAEIRSFYPRSPYYRKEYFRALRAHAVPPVPVMSISGYTDPLFPPVQTLQMFRKLRAVAPGYPMTMVFGDIGHSNAGNPAAQWHPINRLANRFLDAWVLGKRAGRPRAQSYSFRTRCAGALPKLQRPIRGRWNALARGEAVASSAATKTTVSHDPNSDGSDTDPIANTGCLTESAGTMDPGGAYWTFDAKGVTMLGLPRVRFHYALTGPDAAIAFKLWDVAPDGSKVLVTRGGYRLNTSQGDPATGILRTQLFGNHWTFAKGHEMQLQITQNDSPFLRPDNEPSSLEISNLRVTLPLRHAGIHPLQQA